MAEDSWGERAKALEESFFMNRNRELLDELREHLKEEKELEALAKVSGIKSETVLKELHAVEISAETVAALALVPMISIAWADGTVQDGERDAILEAAHSEGIETGTLTHKLLEGWLHDPPGPELLEAWKHYVQSVVGSFSPAGAAEFHQEIMDQARKVAKAAGGILGIHAISRAEQQLLDELDAAFSK